MKLRFLTYCLIAITFVLNSCKENESPNLVFAFDGESYTLKGANLYLTREANTYNGTHHHRDYFITDGVYTNAGEGDGWDMDDYTDATYFLAIELGTPLASDFVGGEFPNYSSWGSIGETENMSYIDWESGIGDDSREYYSNDDLEEFAPVVVSGGLDGGGKMTLTFNGKLTYYYYDGLNWVEETVTGKFRYTGTVNDERPI